MNSRTQVTLFLDQHEVSVIERVRAKWNPEQYELINAHITLVRDERVEDFASIVERVKKLKFPCFQVKLGAIERFCEGKGVFIPVLDPEMHLLEIRKRLKLDGTDFDPHITIMHPRNATCTDEIFKSLLEVTFPSQLSVNNVSVIKQTNGSKWEITHQFPLNPS